MRLRRTAATALLVAPALLGISALTGCAPPPICHSLKPGINLHDATGNGDDHLHTSFNVCVDSIGNVTNSTGSNSASQYGFLNTFGNVVVANPVWAAGNTGTNYGADIQGWVNSTQYSITAVWDIRLGYTVGGVGVAGDKGECTATWPLIITSGGGNVDSGVVVNLGQVRTKCHNGFYLSYAT